MARRDQGPRDGALRATAAGLYPKLRAALAGTSPLTDEVILDLADRVQALRDVARSVRGDLLDEDGPAARTFEENVNQLRTEFWMNEAHNLLEVVATFIDDGRLDAEDRHRIAVRAIGRLADRLGLWLADDSGASPTWEQESEIRERSYD